MSSVSGNHKCPVCGGDMMSYLESRPHDKVFGRCTVCGYSYFTSADRLDFDEVQKLRENYDLEPLEKEEYDKLEDEVEEYVKTYF